MIKRKMRRLAVLAFVLIFSLVTGILSPIFIELSYGWFAEKNLTPHNAEVMPGFYAGGDGTADKPYLITRPIHLYNLAWLQQRGVYNTVADGETTLQQTYFELAENLDMTGYTLPPIGTEQHPFIGVFSSTEGKKHTIANLTVSNVIDNGEITKRPHGINEITGVEIVGMFGVVGQYNNNPTDATYNSIVPKVENFFLENTTIRTQTEKSLAGLIAGYVNGKVHEVGVYGGSLVSGQNNNTGIYKEDDTISLYTLIGNRDRDVGWDGVSRPGEDAGGVIKVDVNEEDTYNDIYAIREGGYTAVPGSMPDHAFVTGTPSFGTNKVSNLYYFNTLVTTNNNLSTTTVGTDSDDTVRGNFVRLSSPNLYSEGWLDTNVNSTFSYNKDLETALTRISSNNRPYSLSTGTEPNANDKRTITLADGKTTREIPDRGVWFQPVSPGHCLVAFFFYNKGGTPAKSIYKYRRENDNPNGAIDASTWRETRFDISSLSNQSLAVFEYEITQADIDNHYEFIIGSPSNMDKESIHFYFMALAGASNTGGSVITSTSLELFNVNFIDQPGSQYTGMIAGPNMTVTTFYVTLLAKNKTEAKDISFWRDSMDAPAYVTNPTAVEGIFEYHQYTHTIPQSTNSS